MNEPPRWLDRDHAAQHLCIRPDELRRIVKAGRIPAPSYHLGPRKPRWDRLAIDAAMTGTLAPVASTDIDVAVEAICNDILRRPDRKKVTR